MKRTKLIDRKLPGYTKGEEIFNMVSHIVGVGLGIIISSKLSSYLLKNYKNKTMSFILGLILMSAIVIFPVKSELYNLVNILTSIVTLIIGGSLILILEKVKNKKED